MILVPLPGIKPIPPALGAWGLNHWPTSEVPKEPHFSLQMEKGKERKCTQGNSPGLWRWTERVVYFPISHTHRGLHVSVFHTHTHTHTHTAVCFLVSYIDTHTQGCVFFYFSHIHIHTQRAVCFPVSHRHRHTPHTHTHIHRHRHTTCCKGPHTHTHITHTHTHTHHTYTTHTYTLTHTHIHTHTHTHPCWKGPNLACAGKLAAYSSVKNYNILTVLFNTRLLEKPQK